MERKLQAHLAAQAWEIDKLVRGLAARPEIVMGGGSAIAARHGHRHSTDIDLWLGAQVWTRMTDRHGETEAGEILQGRIARMREGGTAELVVEEGELIRIGNTKCTTPWSLQPLWVSEYEEKDKDREVVEELGWQLMGDAEIIAGKMRRMRNEEPKDRDVYDLCVLGLVAPAALDRVVKGTPKAKRRWTAQKLEAYEGSGAGTGGILQPAYEVDLEEGAQWLGRKIWGRRGASRRPPIREMGCGQGRRR